MMPAPPSAGFTRMPVSRAPVMPPMQCTPNTSSESSYPSAFFTVVQKKKHTAPAISPSTIAPIGPEKPAAGVTATRPAMQPDKAPSNEGLPLAAHSTNIQDRAAAAVATKVLIMASAAPPLASRLEPALKPNQPTHRSEAPIIVMVIECGA